MHKNPEISVIIPVYKVEKYLARCLGSVLAQTFTDFEIICVNDGSLDNSAKILEDYAEKDARVKILTQQNQGISMARNNGLKQAKGKYIYFLDSDDYIHPQLLEITRYFITKYNADLVSFFYDTKAHKAEKYHTKNFKHSWKTYNNIGAIPHKFTDNPLKFYGSKFGFKVTDYPWSKLYKRDILDGLEFIPGIFAEDTPYAVVLLKKRPKTVLLNEGLYYYTYNSEGLTKTAGLNYSKVILGRHAGLSYIYEAYKNAPKSDFNFVAANVALKQLKDQYKQIKKMDKQSRAKLLELFNKELIDLDNKNFIGFKLRMLPYYLKFKKMARQFKDKA